MDSSYDVLGVDPDADEADLVRAYRRRVKEAHPDQGGSASEFQAVQRAYERVLSGESLEGEAGLGSETGARSGTPNGTGSDVDQRPGGPPGSRARHGAEPGDGDADGTGRRRAGTARVEYLNYEALDDHGWSLDDDDLFAKAADAGLGATDYGELAVAPGDSLLEAAEQDGFAWPFACRGGACANCAVTVCAGDLSTPVDHILPPEMLDRDIRLSCNGMPLTDELQVVYNVKHLPGLDELRLPPHPFDRARATD